VGHQPGLGTAALACLAVAGAAAVAGGAPTAERLPAGALLVLEGEGATLLPAGPRLLRLTFNRVDPAVTWFADRPGRSAGVIGVTPGLRQVLRSSDGPPNASLALNGRDLRRSLAVELLSGTIDAAGRGRFLLRALPGAAPLAGPVRARDASLSIDGVEGSPPPRTCAVQVTNNSNQTVSVAGGPDTISPGGSKTWSAQGSRFGGCSLQVGLSAGSPPRPGSVSLSWSGRVPGLTCDPPASLRCGQLVSVRGTVATADFVLKDG
jgi:hypothetical protein